MVQKNRAGKGFYDALDEKIKKSVTAALGAKLKVFARRLFASSAESEISKSSVQQNYDTVISAWDFLQQRDSKAAKIELANFTVEQDKGRSRTRIQILSRDMPFLVDSIRQGLIRAGVSIHGINNAVVYVQRTGAGVKALGTLAKVAASCEEDFLAEALVVIRCARLDKAEAGRVKAELKETLKHVNAAVSDFPQMLATAGKLRQRFTENCASLPVPRAEAEESIEFLSWLIDNHFTFLGYEECRISSKGKEQLLTLQRDSRLGVSRFKTDIKFSTKISTLPVGTAKFILQKQICAFAKSAAYSKVHRPAHYDYVLIKEFNAKGEVCTEHRFLGLYTSAVYFREALDIPLVRKKVDKVLKASGFPSNGHDIKNLLQVINVLPRDELFQLSEAELLKTSMEITRIQDSRNTRLFIRKDVYGKFFSCLVYVPRDIFNTKVRQLAKAFLSKKLNAQTSEYNTFSSESDFTRIHFIMRVAEIEKVKFDSSRLESELAGLIKPWDDYFTEGLLEGVSDVEVGRIRAQFLGCFPQAYKEAYKASSAINDLALIEKVLHLESNHNIVSKLSPCHSTINGSFSFKIFSRQQQLYLSDVAPILENLGLNIISEKAFELHISATASVWLHDFSVFLKSGKEDISCQTRITFEQAFVAIWEKKVDDDRFNELVLAAELNWRDISLLRAYGAYLKQIQFGYSMQYIAETLSSYQGVSKYLIDYFYSLFDPARSNARGKKSQLIKKKIESAIDEVSNLSEDSVLRALLEVLDATLRTNYFQLERSSESNKSYLSLKLDPSSISHVPLPKPAFEIFVFSPQVEGVHLRGGKVARGGLRWSDRLEDYRTEVLGLVKAQQVKNSVIVPVGAKGGFVVKADLSSLDRDEFINAGINCYKTFISGLLDLTDNRKAQRIVPPANTVTRDEEDSYLVVAADKGTATFSDIANGIAADYDFWLGDGFASGGSNGYDHKQMGITAKGAWVSVQRHFREQGVDVQNRDFSVLGIGDMSGDVFGNGMLLSRHICLKAAFNHLHIFIDPDPNSSPSYTERRRLFNKPGSNWSDYKTKLISKGGGVFARSEKSIRVSQEMKKAFEIEEDSLTPDQLISRLLCSPVDLIWNGGIGTYVKASSETHSDIGDRNNDSLRVNANELRCKVIGEGGNLGLSQLARIEYGLLGGVSLTDFVDNSAGVDCSDHEVNIKIVLNKLLANGELSEPRRNKLLESMTDDVSALVLANNYQQVQAIGIAHGDVEYRNREYSDLIQYLESNAGLNRSLEFLPDHEQLEERAAKKQHLTRPELSVLTSYMKMHLKSELAGAEYIDDHYLNDYLFAAFPAPFVKRLGNEILQHPLRRELVATQLANSVVNLLGPSMVFRMADSTGASVAEIVKAAVIAKDIYQVDLSWQEIESLNYSISSDVQDEMMSILVRLLRRTVRWLLHRHRKLDFADSVDFYRQGIKAFRAMIPVRLPDDFRVVVESKTEVLKSRGVPAALAKKITQSEYLLPGCSFIEISSASNESLSSVVDYYYCVGEELKLNWLGRVINQLRVGNHWQALARETYLDELSLQQQILSSNIIKWGKSLSSRSASSKVTQWMEHNQIVIGRVSTMILQLQAEAAPDYSMVSVVLRELQGLAKATSQ